MKDAFEDNKRHKSDNEENSREYEQLPFGEDKFKKAESRDIKVGMLVKIYGDEAFPCDMYLLNTSLKKGICFVETKNLDGETNLKHK